MREYLLDLAKSFGNGFVFGLAFFGLITLIAVVMAPARDAPKNQSATKEDICAIHTELEALRKVIDSSPFPARPGIANPRD